METGWIQGTSPVQVITDLVSPGGPHVSPGETGSACVCQQAANEAGLSVGVVTVALTRL